MMKVMISCGLRGKKDPVKYREACEETVKKKYGDQIEIVHAHGGDDHDVLNTFPDDKTARISGLGFNIQNELAICDAVIFMDDWHNYTGCQCEHFIAVQYKVPITYMETFLYRI